MSDLLQRLRTALAEQYDVRHELGRGGMSTVFLARDLKHDREVALKLLRPDLASAIGAERFLREIKVTAGLNHPHVLPLLDSGAIDELVWYAMPFVSGSSLRRRLLRSGTVPLDEAIRIAGQVASALDYAHRRGVVHRDVKPENILFSDGHAVVADFGVARALTTVDRQTLTRSGFPVGTLGYMSPEQAAGRADLDGRTDVYGLGCVVYEMLVGDTPYGWPMPEDARLGRFQTAPDAHRALLDALPGRIEQALACALAFRPEDRFETAGAFAEALEAATVGRERISDDAARAILARAAGAAEEPEAARTALEDVADLDHTRALTIGSLEQAAAGAGIPPERVRAAARELGKGDVAARAPVRVPGRTREAPGRTEKDEGYVPVHAAPDVRFARSRLRAERVLPVAVPGDRLADLVAEIEDELDLIGHASIVGRTLTWSPAGQGAEGRQLVVTVRPRGDGTEIHLEERYELIGLRQGAPGLGGVAGLIFGGAFGSGLGLGEPALLLTMLPGAALGAWMTVKGMQNTFAQSRSLELQALLDRLSRRLVETGGE